MYFIEVYYVFKIVNKCIRIRDGLSDQLFYFIHNILCIIYLFLFLFFIQNNRSAYTICHVLPVIFKVPPPPTIIIIRLWRRRYGSGISGSGRVGSFWCARTQRLGGWCVLYARSWFFSTHVLHIITIIFFFFFSPVSLYLSPSTFLSAPLSFSTSPYLQHTPARTHLLHLIPITIPI